MGFSRQEYWSGLSFPSPGDLPDPGIRPRPPALQADSLPSEPPGTHPRWPLSKKKRKIEITSVSEDAEKLEPLSTVGGNVKWCNYCGKEYKDAFKN